MFLHPPVALPRLYCPVRIAPSILSRPYCPVCAAAADAPELLGKADALGTACCHIMLDKDEEHAFAANYDRCGDYWPCHMTPTTSTAMAAYDSSNFPGYMPITHRNVYIAHRNTATANNIISFTLHPLM